MANENNDISDIVKKCKILLLDIEGTTTSISFVKDKLFPYAEENVKELLNTHWESEDVKEAVAALRKLAVEDQEKSLHGVVPIPADDATKEDQIEGLVKSVKWQMSSDRKVGALKQLQGLIWKRGYDKGEIKGHIYEDVAPAIELWRSVEGHKVYIYSSGSVQAQKLLFASSSAGNLLPHIDGHFDTAVGAKQESSSYTAIAEKIGCKPDEILFLTDILEEASAACDAGARAALVSRPGNAPLAAGAAQFPLLHSLAQLAASNKRKPDPQDEQPAKVPKTDVDGDVKTNVDPGKAPETVAEKVAEEPEKMEVVEEVTPPKDAAVEATVANKLVEKAETIVAEVTEVNNVADMPVCDIEPIIEESVDKTDKKETEKMETESSEKTDSASEPKDEAKVQNGDNTPDSEETGPTVITEITDVTDDKESLSEVAEMIDDVVPVVVEPVVEEPAANRDMEELQNVGEVLEKECDEILSKVQDVTNLDNIPLKPLLHPIAEETMDTDNPDTSDIVERILDSEELDMKQCGDIDLNTVEAISETKAVEQGKGDGIDKPVVEEKATEIEEKATEKVEEINTAQVEEKAADKATNKVEEVKMATESIETSTGTEENAKITSPTEPQAEAGKPSDANKVDQEKHKVDIEQNNVKNEESKKETKEIKVESDTAKMKENTTEMETEASNEAEASKANSEDKTEEITVATVENKAETSDSKAEIPENKTEDAKESPMETEKLEVENKDSLAEQQTDTPAEPKAAESTPEEIKTDSATTDTQVNGKTTNGDADMVNVNGDTSNDEELSSRLSMENGKDAVNGANGDSTDATQGQADNTAKTEVPDIKVKTVASDEPRGDPIEQPTEA